MTTLTDSELSTINGGLPFNLPPQLPQPLINEAYWTQREFWAYLYDS